jgi:hypothetical protein
MAAYNAYRQYVCGVEYLLGDIGAKIANYLSSGAFLPLLSVLMTVGHYLL